MFTMFKEALVAVKNAIVSTAKGLWAVLKKHKSALFGF